MVNQLTLGIGLNDDATFANYYVGPNQQLVEELKKTSSGIGERVIYLHGLNGEGCTHLLQACCHQANQQALTSVYLPLANIKEFLPAMFEGLESLSLVCVDELQKIVGHPEWEEAFFHLYNRLHDAGSSLIVAANVQPKLLNLLPDIVSRLTWGMVFQLQTLTDEEKIKAMIMRAGRRGMTLSEEVSKFILTHCPRHMATLFAALNALDKASLAAQRKLTIPFVKSVLQI